MVKQFYINGEFTREQLEHAAKKGREARHAAYAKSNHAGKRALDDAELTGLEAALNALTDMWSEGQEDPDNA